MGVSKRLSEILCQEFQSKNPNLNISIVRFGNVLMSSGSVIPLFQEQIQSNQPITITDKRMKRYFMDLNEAAELILQASSISSNDSEVFVLDMGEPISIIEIANQLIKINGKSPSINHNKGIKIKIIGAKKGEKIFEELFVDKNKKITIHPKIFKARERLKKQVITKIFIKRISNLIENRDEIGLIKFFKKLDIGFKIND
jgi:FlaA1/EpsC-like NDP-sugar epimerase